MRCLPFATALYRDLQRQGIDAAGLWQQRDRYQRALQWPRHAEALEELLRAREIEHVPVHEEGP